MRNFRIAAGVFAFVIILSVPNALVGQVDVPRRTTAITYPLDQLVYVQFRGTTRFPRMKGEARIRRTSRNGSEIDLSVSKMPRPFELGAGYATYVLWAVSPEGQVDNLGEIKRRGFFEFDSRIRVTTKLQTFALLITAEPHFLVSRPSQEIMLENLSPYTRSGRTMITTPSIQYFGNSSDYFRDSRTPEIAEVDYSRTPSTILQAKQAVALARFAGADRDAEVELREAESLLVNAEDSWRAGRKEEDVDITARQAISAAVKAESTALIRRDAREKRDERLRTDAEIRSMENRHQETLDEIESLKQQLAAEIRNRELAERDSLNYSGQVRDLRAENGRLREELGRTRVEADNAKARLESIENAQRAFEEQRAREERMNSFISAQPALIQSLRRFGSVDRNDRGIIVTLPETFWSAIRSADFAPTSDERLGAIAQLLNENPDYRVIIESHTDNRGNEDELMTLTQRRSQAISERLMGYGVAGGRIEAKGFAATIPVAPNTTNANRARNRRVQVVLVPAI
ncbi:MAG TPA: OmpA family protein [Pyrinomonadaceae bacterium]|nr:OmpA family protein [Pyrinomonadaceae bacterium]